jgi:hypothetical protein
VGPDARNQERGRRGRPTDRPHERRRPLRVAVMSEQEQRVRAARRRALLEEIEQLRRVRESVAPLRTRRARRQRVQRIGRLLA